MIKQGLPFRRIAIMTSGGDAPGMNTALRAAVRAGIKTGFEIIGVERGFAGLLEGSFRPLNSHDAGDIMQFGGTVLRTARSERFKTLNGREQALENIGRAGIEALIIIGGNGSLSGGLELERMGMPVVGIPASIDNDMYGTCMAIGVDTCLNNIVNALDKIKDTASSHKRAFVVEVMGHKSGYLALTSALASGAEVAVIPEIRTSLSEIACKMEFGMSQGKSHTITIVAEGSPLKSHDIYKYLCRTGQYETRLSILGHLQRGGSPTAYDRVIASSFGSEAIECLREGITGVMVGQLKGRYVRTSLEQAVRRTNALNKKMYELVQHLN